MKKNIIVLLILVSAIVQAQEPVQDDLVTDRPDQTESAAIVPKKHFQIETGFVYQQDNNDEMDLGELGLFTTLLRYGVNEYFELRLGTAFLNVNQKPAGEVEENISGMAPLFGGIKFKMLQENGAVPEMAFLLTVEFPKTGKEEFSPEHMATDMRFAIEYSISDRLGFATNLGGRWNGTDAKAIGVYTFVLGYDLGSNMGLFVESFGFLPTDQLPDHRLDGGLTYLLKDNLQLDVSAGLGLSEVSPDYFINAGLSWRIPN